MGVYEERLYAPSGNSPRKRVMSFPCGLLAVAVMASSRSCTYTRQNCNPANKRAAGQHSRVLTFFLAASSASS